MEEKHTHLVDYCLRIGDTSLIAGQRLAEWCGHGPELEEDIALSNMSLDLIGQARIMLSYAGELEGKGRTEDRLAYFRDERDYRNLLLAEQPNGDFAQTMARHFLLSVYLLHVYDALKKSNNEMIRGFAEKSWKEIAYHVRHSSDWMLRLGDGTEESHRRLQDAVDELWAFTDDLFHADETDEQLAKTGVAPDLNMIRTLWNQEVEAVFSRAFIQKPLVSGYMKNGSRQGLHTEHLGYMLADMQFLARAYPDAKW